MTHAYWHGLVLTEAAVNVLAAAADEQEMTAPERRALGLAAARQRRARNGRYITVADAEHAVGIGGRQ